MFLFQRFLIRSNQYSKWNLIRKYSTNIQPIKMVYNVFETNNTDKNLPPFMVMHGLFGSKQNWRSVCNELKLKTNRKLFALDARNHGESPHTDEHGSKYLAADTVHLMQQLNIKKVAAMGHGMGGRAMMYLALKHPELVERLVVIDISPLARPGDNETMEKIFKAMRSINIPKEMQMPDARKLAKKLIGQLVESDETINYILINLKKDPDGTFKWAFNMEGLYKTLRGFHDFMKQIADIKPYEGDVLFICGNRSSFVDPKSEHKITPIFPKAQFEWLNTGHLVHLEEPQKFIQLLVRFLNK